MAFEAQKNELAYFMRRLYERRLTTTLGGNASVKVSDTEVLITPSGIDKGTLIGEQIGIVRRDGENLTPTFKLSMETPMHLAVYNARPEVKAVVHAHPPVASSFAATSEPINCKLIGESRLMLKDVGFAPYACMGTDGLARSVVRALSTDRCAVLMANHGVLTVGDSLLQAFDRMEVVESAAKITLMVKLLGGSQELNPRQLEEIDCLFG
jgi:L-fuculose-phosphate aldolase